MNSENYLILNSNDHFTAENVRLINKYLFLIRYSFHLVLHMSLRVRGISSNYNTERHCNVYLYNRKGKERKGKELYLRSR